MTLTEAEKREARATDRRAANILDRVEAMPAAVLEGLHGAIRTTRPAPGAVDPTSEEMSPTGSESQSEAGSTPELFAVGQDAAWWDPAADAAVDPFATAIEIDHVRVCKGSRVRLRPGRRRADAQDMFLVGRVARVEGVFCDVDERNYLAVTLEDDPAADLQQVHGRFLYFDPDEVEPMEERR